MKAIWNGAIIASSDSTVVVEGNHYFPPDSVRYQYLEPTELHTTCPWKGEASYFNVVVKGELNESAAWYYADPKVAAEQIRGYIAFWRGVTIED